MCITRERSYLRCALSHTHTYIHTSSVSLPPFPFLALSFSLPRMHTRVTLYVHWCSQSCNSEYYYCDSRNNAPARTSGGGGGGGRGREVREVQNPLSRSASRYLARLAFAMHALISRTNFGWHPCAIRKPISVSLPLSPSPSPSFLSLSLSLSISLSLSRLLLANSRSHDEKRIINRLIDVHPVIRVT